MNLAIAPAPRVIEEEQPPPKSEVVPKVERDLRIDMMRGAVMIILLTVHFEVYSYLNLLTWERVGIIAGGEGFVMLSGLVIGMVYGPRVALEGVRGAIQKLYKRGAQIYRTNLFVVVSVFLLSLIPVIKVTEIMTFTNRASGMVYKTYPAAKDKLAVIVARLLLLRAGPHQVQILGLFVVLIFATPLFLWALSIRKTPWLLALSALLYIYNWAYKAMPIGAQFEYAFPILTWQILYVYGLAVGYHRERIVAMMSVRRIRLAILGAASAVTALGFFIAQNSPNPLIPEWMRLHVISPDAFNKFYTGFCDKNTLGMFRLLNYAALLIVAYWLMGYGWKYWNRAIGWLLIPLGQASLYVFIIHTYLVAIAAVIVPFNFRSDPRSMLIATAVHVSAIAILWTMVKTRFLFRWVPR